MDDVQLELVRRLHSAARRYCEERYAHWSEVYARMGQDGSDRVSWRGASWDYSDRAKDTFPRYNALDAILRDIESVVPEELVDLPKARRALASLAYRAQTMITQDPGGEIQANAIDDERDRFAAFVERVDEADLWEVQLLPYRRTLKESEVDRYRELLKERWGVDGYWIPLVECKLAEPVLVWSTDRLGGKVRPPDWGRILRELRVSRLYELREHGGSPSQHLDAELVRPYYDFAEAFWFTDEMEWLLYASHEGSMAAAGEPLVRAIEEVWPAVAQHPWTLR